MDIWYREIGFYSNPFSIKPAAFHDEVIGYNLQSFLEKIETGKVQYVRADYGNGKTTMLKHIIRRFGGKKRVAYCSCNIVDGNLNTRELLMGRSFFNKAFSLMPKNMILLVDEAQDMTMEEAEDILQHYKLGNIKSVVFFGTEIKPKNFPREVSTYLKDIVIFLSKVSPEKAVEIVRKRIGNLGILSDSIIKKLYAISGDNPRRLLENCEDLCKYVISKNESAATERHLKALFKTKLKSNAPKAKARKAKGKKREPEIKIEEIDDKNKVNLKFDYANIRTYEEEMAFGRRS